MKQDKCLFLTATIASILSLYDINAYAGKITCPAGKMLPAGSESCVECNSKALSLYIPNGSNPDTFYCPGGVFVVNSDRNQGIQICSAEATADSKHKRCEKRKISKSRAVVAKKLSEKATANTGLKLEKAIDLKKDIDLKLTKDKKLDKLDSSGLLAELKKSKVSCKYGQYLPKNSLKCEPCFDRYYCLGGTFTPSGSDQGLKTCKSGYEPNSDHTKCVVQKKKKPDSFIESLKNRVRCSPGQYLPKNVKNCAPCKNRYYCPGGLFLASTTDVGLKTCKPGFQPDETRKKCVSSYVSCTAGTYLPINKNHCADCLAGYYCEGGKWMPDSSMNHGLTKCASGLVSAKGSKKLSDCVKPVPDMVTCEPGKYLPAKQKECRECSGTNKYCPGVGPVRPSNDIDQGIRVCPLNTSTNKTKSACQITLTKDMLRYGIGKTAATEMDDQCWVKKEIPDYEKCMFGGKLNITSSGDASSTQKK